MVSLGAALTIAPIAEVSAAQPSLGMRLRTIMTLTPDAPEGEAEADAGAIDESGDVESATEVEASAEPTPAPEGPPPPPADPEPSRGLGLLISGAVVTGAVGLPLTLWGSYIVIASRAVDDGDLGSGLVSAVGTLVGGVVLFFGVVGLGVGVPLLGVGGYRFSRWREWQARQGVRLLPSAGLSLYGTVTPGLTLRF